MPLDGIVRGVALCPELLDQGLSLFDSGETHELAPQAQAPLLAMNAAAPLLRTVDGVAPVALVEERVQAVLVADDRVDLVQRQPRSCCRFDGSYSGGRHVVPPLAALLWETMRVPALSALHGSPSFVQ
jgi:hypothetical protein